MTHRHVFFADEPVAAVTAEWTCACGIVAGFPEGDLDGGLVVLATPAPDEFAAVARDVDAALVDAALADAAPVGSAQRRRTA